MRQMEGPEADSGHLGVPQMDGGLGRGILEEELDETDLFIYEDDGSSIATGIGSDDRTNVSEKRGEKDFFLDDEGIIYAKRFADKMQHHMNARESKTRPYTCRACLNFEQHCSDTSAKLSTTT